MRTPRTVESDAAEIVAKIRAAQELLREISDLNRWAFSRHTENPQARECFKEIVERATDAWDHMMNAKTLIGTLAPKAEERET